MRAEVLREALTERRRFLAWWVVGLVAFVALQLVFYPSVRDATGLNDYSKDLSEAMRALFVGGETDLTSPVGYLNSQIFAFVGPLLLLIFAVGLGGGLIAGDEERGMLDYTLAQPVTRAALVGQRLAALAVATGLITLVLALTIAVVSPVFDLRIGFWNLLAASVSCGLLGLLYGALAIGFGALMPGRSRAMAIPGALAVAAWVLDGLAQAVEGLEPWRPLSPFYQALGHAPLRDGAPWGGWALLVAATVVVGGAAVLALQRRDIRQ
jgi:ABC-2 type transport system permease protein